MCDSLYNRDTGQEINSQDELVRLVGIAIWQHHEEAEPEEGYCLCDIDHEAMVKEAGYVWEPYQGNTMDVTIYRP